MIKFKRLMSLVLAVALFAAVCPNGSGPVFAVDSEPTLTAVPAGVTPTEEFLGTQIAYVANDTVTVYEYYENGALGMVCTGALGEQIELTAKFTYTVDGVDTVIYHFAASDFTGAMGAADVAHYQFILASDVTFTAPEGTGPDISDPSAGVSVDGDLPEGVSLTVTPKTLAESGIDTTVYPISGASLFYDVTLLQNSAEYQPENGITVTFPEDAIMNSGLAVGDYYKVYHVHDGATDVTGPFAYTGGAIEAKFDSLSVVGLASTDAVNPTDVFGEYQGKESYTGYAVIKTDTVTVYGDVIETDTTDYIQYSGVKGLQLELSNYKVMYANTNLYYYTYSGTEDFKSYYFIPEEYITLTCCANCTGEAGCTCGCESCTCSSATIKQTLPDLNGTAITVTGFLPVDGYVKATTSANVPSAVIATDHLDFSVTIKQFGYDINLYDENDVEVQPDGFVTVYIPDVWDTSLSAPIVDVYHILDDADAIVTAQANGTLLTTDDAAMVATYAEEATIARTTLGLADTDVDVVAYVLLSSRSDEIELTADGGIHFTTDSFSEYYIVSGDTEADNIREDSTIYIAQGMSGTFTIQNTDVTLTAETVDGDVTVTKGSVSDSGKDRYTTFNVSVTESASIGDTSYYSLSWRGGSGGTRTITVTVVVVDTTEYVKQQYLENTVNHLQIDIASTAVALGYNNDESFSLNLGFTNDTEYTLTKVSDDSSVGFYYVLEYSYTDSDNKVVPVTITVRIDELASKLPEGVTFADVGEEWFVESVIAQESQVTFGNKSDSTQAAFPVGTAEYPIVYSITVETEKELTKNNENTAHNVEISVSNEIQYWDESNECPGANGSQIGSQSGMDLGDFTSGTVLGNTTYYVVFSNLTKVVNGYAFGDNESKNYVFTIYRRTADTTDGDDWTAFDTISITATGVTSSTNFTTDAAKYNVEDITKYDYRIKETGYSISGYGCTNVIEVKKDGSYEITEGGIFTFSQSADGNTVIYSAEIKCTNTYSEAGLTVSKVTENAPSSAAEDTFTVKVWPMELSEEGIEIGTNMYTYFNNASAYKIAGTAVDVTGGSDSAYGYIEFTIKGGESKTITGLPAGTYYVQEIAGTNTNWTYDTEVKTANLTSGSAAVTVTNTYKYADLTIIKKVEGTTAKDTFIFHIQGNDESNSHIDMDVTITGSGSVKICDLPLGSYTVTEDTDWSWRYTAEEDRVDVKLSTDAEVTFTNNYDNSQWLNYVTKMPNTFGGNKVENGGS